MTIATARASALAAALTAASIATLAGLLATTATPPAAAAEPQNAAKARTAPAPAPKPTRSTAKAPAGKPLPTITVHKTPTCGCCAVWVEHLRSAGMSVVVRDHDDLGPIKQRLGIPYGKGSCHTAEVAGYFVEGHVPAVDIRRMLTEKPKIKGLVLPGMPLGSPGMEVPGRPIDPYTVEAVQPDGSTKAYANHGGLPGRS